MGAFVPLSQGYIAVAPVLERWVGLGLYTISLGVKKLNGLKHLAQMYIEFSLCFVRGKEGCSCISVRERENRPSEYATA